MEADLICRSHACSLGILFSVPSDGRTDTRHQQNSSHTWHTTSTLAFSLDCIHVRIHRRRIFYRDHEASACRLLRDAHRDVGETHPLSENSRVKETCGGEDNG